MSSIITFNSSMQKTLREFVAMKQLSGTDYASQARNLKYFDTFLVEQDFAPTVVTQQAITDYMRSCQHVSVRTRDNRLSVLRQFCLYLSRYDSRCYIPDRTKPKESKDARTPYIFTRKQIYQLLAQAAKLSPENSLRSHTYYTLFGILYGTGIRIGEALALNIEDVNLRESQLHIKQGKFRKSRWVPFSDSVGTILRAYFEHRQQILTTTPNSPLFISLRHNRLSHPAAWGAFRTILAQCKIDNCPAPRIHDLRHSFAVRRLFRWYQEKKDIYALLPSLATYMGHVNLFSTQCYIHSTPELLAIVSDNFETHYSKNINTGGQTNEQ